MQRVTKFKVFGQENLRRQHYSHNSLSAEKSRAVTISFWYRYSNHEERGWGLTAIGRDLRPSSQKGFSGGDFILKVSQLIDYTGPA